MNKYIIYFPFGYTFLSRIKTSSKFISFLLTIPLPCFLFFYFGLLDVEERTLSLGTVFILTYSILYIFYENGYVENDIKTVKKEVNPTLRIVGELYNYIDDNYYRIIIIRVFFYALSLYFLSFFTIGDVIVKVVFFSIATSVIYFFHNRTRNAMKVFTFLLLSSSRFVFPLMVFSSYITTEKIEYIPLSLFIYTIPAFFIYSAKTFTIMQFVIGHENKYKLIYYASTCIVFLILYYLVPSIDVLLLMAAILFYMLLLISLKKILNK
ncbi:hypothetical protein C3433_20865 [Citrobacter freundii]|nr:hypothetical protein C3433_20865 [Citrobacter freundii]